ncbi:YqaJ-like recombinase protein [Rhodococcus sp. AG1013]|uniref:YqaJ viral recombinase family protein n=1 Tax=Rhodococcus sp. AG1013 TaxID=2183996 RepID=UPI000E0BD88B|nr:YqaJ viral recombinase family protein [Rhodococcus sp. AG1013]RDI13489.1 YqaJ-like recombinase protein [Rhodococcus sp. AG1013]
MSSPTLTELPSLVQGTDEWHDQRRGIVTASVVGNLIATRSLSAIDYDCPSCDAQANDPCRSKVKAGATIKTLHSERAEVARRSRSSIVFETASNDTSRSVTALLVAERITNWTDPTYISDDMLRGIEDEPRARDIYAEHFAPVRETGIMIRDDNGVRIGYSPDGLVGDDGLIEVKSRRQKKQVETVISGHPPAENMAQLQCGLLVSGRKWIDYISYSGGMHLWVKRVYPDQRWFDAITAAVHAFEENAAEMIRLYEESVVGLPLTERIIEMEMVV